MKFIDTSVESDLPPTLSQLQRKSFQLMDENTIIQLTPSNLTDVSGAINQLTDEQLKSINNDGSDEGTSEKSSPVKELSTNAAAKVSIRG
jgi:hypothetical protein